MTSYFKNIFLVAVFIIFSHGLPAYANNISVSNAGLGAQDTGGQTMEIQFDITWEHSWSDAINSDAAWVFVKYSTDGGVTWSHATLKRSGTNPSGFSGGSGTSVNLIVPTDKKGVFIQRSAAGNGTLSATDVKFVWDYGADIGSDFSYLDAITAVIKVFAIEMVYVPLGSFYIGDGDGSSQSIGAFYQNVNTSVLIDNTLKQSIKCGSTNFDDAQLTTTGIGIKGDAGLDTNNDGTIDNLNFPTGYNAFYMMKYEISQGQYRNFLNTLTRLQQKAHVASNIANDSPEGNPPHIFVMTNTSAMRYRNGIVCPSSGNGTTDSVVFSCDLNGTGTYNEAADGEWIACGSLSWNDLSAYADWAALRPMTELEFEKACRGTDPSVNREYAWGSNDITGTISLSAGTGGTTSERSGQSGHGLCNYENNAIGGPLRCGFAAMPGATRDQAGSSYYGIMELSGNLWEKAVSLGASAGRAYTGVHGNGSLDPIGSANVPNWSSGPGTGSRGGATTYGASDLQVSDRLWSTEGATGRNNYQGGRFVRTAP